MNINKESKEPQLNQILPQLDNDKIPALPLRFQSLPIELLSKQFTKLNSNHAFRVHYLGPRPYHTLALHKRYAFNEEFKLEEGQIQRQKSYPAPLRRIVNSNYMNEQLRDNTHYRSSFFYRAFQGMNPTLPPEEIAFNSVFQNGNLDCAIKVGPHQYDLFLRIDSNSRGHTNWYHFSIRNQTYVGHPLRINICNLKKRPGLYDQGFKPYIKSKKAEFFKKETWQQRGEEIQLEPASLRYDFLGSKAQNFYRLSFTYTFQYEQDQVFFAYCPPYTYSNLQQDLTLWEQSKYVKKRIIGRSLSGLQLPVLHITNHQSQQDNSQPKKNIVVTGRVHPAQTSGSFVLKGFIKWILEESQEAKDLRDRANIFVVPMLNPDGVVLGNSRTSAAGKDLNRQFLSVRRDLYPEVYLVKTLIARLQKKYGVLVFLDFHGHSRRKNTFFYGPAYPISHRQYYRCRAFPRIVQKINPCFRFYSCSFQISQCKKSAARAIALTQLRVPYAYTVESSVGLYYNPHLMKTFNFTIDSWEEMGSNICQGLAQFILGLEELETIARERKIQREKIKQSKTRDRDRGQRERERDRDRDPRQKDWQEKKEKKKYFLFDVIEEVKVSVSKGGFDEDIESDDHDSSQDLQPYQLAEFNNLVIGDKQKQRKTLKKIVEQQNFQIFHHQQEDLEEINPYEEAFKMQPRMAKSVEPKTSWPKIVPSTQREVRKKLISEDKSKETVKIEAKNFIKENKLRYSSSNLKIYGEDRREIIMFPKSPLTKREREMKNKEVSQVQTRRKRISSLIDQLCCDKSHNNFVEASAYKGLGLFQIDNRAMKITAFRRK